MPLQIPTLDDRRYQDLLDEALARIPVHNPEWTNFNQSDPGVTLIEVFAFLTENLLYRSNQIPERNRKKFLSLLGVPLRPASSARGLVVFTHKRNTIETVTLNGGLEVQAGQVPFRTEQGLDVLPVDAQVYYKRPLPDPARKLKDYYNLLYASYRDTPVLDDTELQLYETVPLDERNAAGVALGQETVDHSLWVALLTRATDKAEEDSEKGWEALRTSVREALAGKTLSLGIAPASDETGKTLSPAGPANPQGESLLQYVIPLVSGDGRLPDNPQLRVPQYKALDVRAPTDVLAAPGVVEISLPASANELRLWSDLDPLEAGVGNFPPALDDTNLSDRVVTWLRVQASAAVRARILWAGVNATFVTQRAHVANELLPAGTGNPDQIVVLSRRPVVPHSVRLTVTAVNGEPQTWREIDDLLSAGPEVPVEDLRQPPRARMTYSPQPPREYSEENPPPAGARPGDSPTAHVFTVNPESGEVKFGDGFHGKRPPAGATIRASYDYGVGAAGNVGPGSLNGGPALPEGISVSNPVRTWNGAEAESASDGEKHITRYLQHRDRLVTAVDFETVALRTPGVDIGRIEVLSAFNPELSQNEPGDAPGAVTLLVIPRSDPKHPDTPEPDRFFLDAVCRYLDPRRLVTTEVFLRGPVYKPVWVSVGITAMTGASVSAAEVREAVKAALRRFLAPIGPDAAAVLDSPAALLHTPQYADTRKGWPLRKPVTDRELLAAASRVPGVRLVNDVKIAEGGARPTAQIPMVGLQLPRVAGISVTLGDPIDIDQLRGQGAATTATEAGGAGAPRIVPVPIVPEDC